MDFTRKDVRRRKLVEAGGIAGLFIGSAVVVGFLLSALGVI